MVAYILKVTFQQWSGICIFDQYASPDPHLASFGIATDVWKVFL